MLTMFSRNPRLRASIAAMSSLSIVGSACLPVYAQGGPPPEQGQPPDQPPPAPAFTRQKLEQLAAPIALYPDTLLTQIMMAATYPLDVVQAARWRRSNSRLKGPALDRALQDQTWDESVKAIVAIPEVIKMMDERLEWTEQLGEAFLAQEQDLLQAVQDLRMRAEKVGNLKSTKQQRVTRQGSYVVIEPAQPDIVYVPVYQPEVYGAWEYPEYPPERWYPPPRRVSDNALIFGAAVVVGAALFASWDWNRRRVAVDPNRFRRFTPPGAAPRTTWQHDPARRRGAPYRAPVLVNKFTPGQPGNVQGTVRRPPTQGTGAPGVPAAVLPGTKGPAAGVPVVPQKLPQNPIQNPNLTQTGPGPSAIPLTKTGPGFKGPPPVTGTPQVKGPPVTGAPLVKGSPPVTGAPLVKGTPPVTGAPLVKGTPPVKGAPVVATPKQVPVKVPPPTVNRRPVTPPVTKAPPVQRPVVQRPVVQRPVNAPPRFAPPPRAPAPKAAPKPVAKPVPQVPPKKTP